jgi:transposase, IS30 family
VIDEIVHPSGNDGVCIYLKGTDITALPDEYITFVENELNNRPRKRFGFLSPNQVFHNITKNGGVAFAS